MLVQLVLALPNLSIHETVNKRVLALRASVRTKEARIERERERERKEVKEGGEKRKKVPERDLVWCFSSSLARERSSSVREK